MRGKARIPDGDSLNELKSRLSAAALQLGEALFGKPSQRPAKNEIRWGRKGSTSFRRRSGRLWSFKSFEADEGGSLLDAIMFAHDTSFKDACDWARTWLGDPDLALQAFPAPAFNDVDREEDKRAKEARQIWSECRPLHGTPAEAYLRSRGIIAAVWPKHVGYHPKLRAIVFAATVKGGAVRSIQLVYLTLDGAPMLDTDNRKIKRTRGPMTGTAVRFSGDNDGPLNICEGPETALSVWLATGFETWAMRGSMASAPLDDIPADRTVIICRDDDPRNPPAQKRLNRRIRTWRNSGRTVVEALPWPKTRRDKTDFNDALVQDGPEAVRQRVLKALEPTSTTPGKPLLEARTAVAKAIHDSMTELQRWLPATEDDEAAPFHVIRCTTGLGKTEEGLRAAIKAIQAGSRVVYLAPTHALINGVAERARVLLAKAGSPATVEEWEGIDRLCTQPEMLEAAKEALANPGETICQICPDRATCRKLAQSKARPDLWIAPSALLFHGVPAEMRGADIGIVDETFASQAFVGAGEDEKIVLSIDEMRTTPVVLDRTGSVKKTATGDHQADLEPYRRKISAALDGLPPGPVARDALVAAGLTVTDCDEAHKIERERKIPPPALNREPLTWEGMKQRLDASAGNRDVARHAMLWQTVRATLTLPEGAASGHLEIQVIKDRDTKTSYRAVRMYGIRAIARSWRQVPALHLDATGDMEVIHTVVPHAELRADIVADAPHARVTQHFDKAFSKGALDPSNRLAGDAWRWCVAEAQKAGGEWLVITHKKHADFIRETFTVPPFMHLAHHGAIEGRDEWRGVRGVIVIGMPRPPPKAMERLAGIIRGHKGPCLADDAWYPAELITLEAKDGTKATVEVEVHPDSIANAFLRAASIGRVIQAIGRGRGVNRNAAEPLDVLVLGNTPLDAQPDSLALWHRADVAAEVMATVGMFTENYADLAKIAPGMFRTPKAALRALEKARTSPRPYKEFLYGLGEVLEAEYQPAGRGMKPRRAWIDRRWIEDPVAFLTARIGPLASFDWIDDAAAIGLPAAQAPEYYVQVTKRGSVEPYASAPRSRSPGIGGMANQKTDASPKALPDALRTLAAGLGLMSIDNEMPAASRAHDRPIDMSMEPPSAPRDYAGNENPPASVQAPPIQPVLPGINLPIAVPDLPSGSKTAGYVMGDWPATALIVRKARDLLDAFEAPHSLETAQALAFARTGGELPPDLIRAYDLTLQNRWLTHEEAAAEFGVSRTHLSNARSGTFGLSPEYAHALVAWIFEANGLDPIPPLDPEREPSKKGPTYDDHRTGSSGKPKSWPRRPPHQARGQGLAV